MTNTAGSVVGISQGYATNFPDGNFNRNWKMILEDGQLDVLDNVIVAGDGVYEKYTGGTVDEVIESPDPNYVSQITLVEPLLPVDNQANEDDEPLTVRITAEGGYFQAINAHSTEDQIGELFQNPVLRQGFTNGLNQGFAFNFVDVDKYTNGSAVPVLSNRIFFLGGDTLTLLDEAIVQGTGDYSKYTGGGIVENTISLEPYYVADITFQVKKDSVDGVNEVPSEVSWLLKSGTESSMYEAILDQIGEPIGERYQLPLLGSGTGLRKGTILGYNFNFPPSNYTDTRAQGNRHLYFEDGDVTVFNKIIVQGTGAYSKYTGGRLEEVIVSTDPVYSSRITLLPPVEKTVDAADDTVVDSAVTTGSESDASDTVESSSNADTARDVMALFFVVLLSLTL